MKYIHFSFLTFIFFFSTSPFKQAFADNYLLQHKDVQNFIHEMISKYNFNKKELVSIIKDIQLQPKIIKAINTQYEQKSWEKYKELFLTQQRLQDGIKYWQKHQETLIKAEQKYGVPASIIIAIIGVETFYGKKQGDYRVVDALATLAFNYPKRADFFTKELKEYLLLCREQKIPTNIYKGSYAGAIGKPQFMPSSYRHYATNFSNNLITDLINDDDSVIASVANYLHLHGWQSSQEIAQPVKIKNKLSKKMETINTNNKNAEYKIKELTNAGVQPLKIHNLPNKVGLIKLNTTADDGYWLAYPNFYVITRYNTSPQYAMAVYLLAQQLKSQWVAKNESNKKLASL